jgi:catechol 2,3-dioxygenase-like lactoylglutathione lyase family enzyme
MFLEKKLVHLNVRDAGRSIAFYEALLGMAPVHSTPTTARFDLDSPPLVLVVAAIDANRTGASDNSTMGTGVFGHTRPRAHTTMAKDASLCRFTLVVNEARHVGDAAIALRRAGVPIRIEDHGIAAHDPDENTWCVRFEPSARGRAVVESGRAR